MGKAKQYTCKKYRMRDVFGNPFTFYEEKSIVVDDDYMLNNHADWTGLEVIEGEVVCYKVDYRNPNGDLATLARIRDGWAKTKKRHYRYETKKTIDKLLQLNFCCYVQGLGEIESIEELEGNGQHE